MSGWIGACVVSLVVAALVPAVSAGAASAATPVVGAVSSPAGGGWEVTSSGSVTATGGAPWMGDMGSTHLNRPIVGMAATADGAGYWLVASDGGIFTFGDARFMGSTGALRLNAPVVGMAATADGAGYWLVASDGGIFTFGDARFMGSTGGLRLNEPVVGMATTSNGAGYWLVASDGGIFTFGDAPYLGSTGALRLNRPVVGMDATSDSRGYWLVASDGGVFTFGDAPFLGSLGSNGATVSGFMAGTGGHGYTLVSASGAATYFPPPSAAPSTSDPLSGASFYVVPDNPAAQAAAGDPADAPELDKVASHSTAIWLGEWNADQTPVVNQYESDATSKGQLPVFVLYAIPDRDCGGYSAGGFATDSQYQQFVDQVGAGIAGRRSVVIVEPDALAEEDSCLDPAQQEDRQGLIAYAVRTLAQAGTSVYLDAGDPTWQTPATMASRLGAAGVGQAQGFSLDVSSMLSTADEEAYGNQISADLGGKHFVIDTSRNGLGPTVPFNWCNPPGRALGVPPTASTDDALTDAFLWVKYPGQSDGSCGGAPVSGAFMPAYAVGLAQRASW